MHTSCLYHWRRYSDHGRCALRSNQDFKKLGTGHTVDTRRDNPVEVIHDMVSECADGSPTQGLSETKVLKQAIELVRSGGK